MLDLKLILSLKITLYIIKKGPLNLSVKNTQKIKENSHSQQDYNEKISQINDMKLKTLETGKLEFVDVKAKLEKLAGDSFVPNNTPQIAENILKNYSSKILSNSQLDLINSIITQYAGR